LSVPLLPSVPNSKPVLYGGVEAGGTKFVCAVGEAGGRPLAEAVFPTTTPAATLACVDDFFAAAQSRHGALAAIGIGSFGPLNLCRDSARYGYLARTPKAGWHDVDMLGDIARATGVPTAIDTDVNVALLGEARHGAGVGCSDIAYITVGTGVGAGLLVEGRTVYGFAHPEVGHMHIPKLADDANFPGACPFHGDRCLEGLASGPALRERWGKAPDELPPEHPAWTLQAHYLAIACLNLLVLCAPRRIVFGGGVMRQAHLFPRVRARLHALLGGYLDFAGYGVDIDTLIVPARLGEHAGIIGAFELARDFALSRHRDALKVGKGRT